MQVVKEKMTRHEQLLAWLNDAHAMEKDLIQVLESHAGQAEDHPDVQERIQKHLKATKDHAEIVKDCIETLGGEVSGVKSFLGELMGAIKGPSTMLAKDRVIKNAQMQAAAEKMEIASYTAIVAAANTMNHIEVIPEQERILQQEKDMEQWLENNIPVLTEDYLAGLETA